MRNSVSQRRARELRHQATDAEQYLWRHLRRRQLSGFRFRRQVPSCGYIADFACLEAKLVIELDGGQHLDRLRYDAYRERRIGAVGFRVLRYWDNELLKETQAVLEDILRVLNSTYPHPGPPPQAGEGS